MGCPVHIWLPLMAGLAPIGRVARDRMRALRSERAARAGAAQPAPVIHRWAPIRPQSGGDTRTGSVD